MNRATVPNAEGLEATPAIAADPSAESEDSTLELGREASSIEPESEASSFEEVLPDPARQAKQ
jgi:hypothetical protein